MKIRVGFGLGTNSTSNDADRLGDLVDGLEHHRFDSLWFSERLTADCVDPLVGMSFAVARTQRLKVGMSVMVLPGRNPVVLAKSIASLDRVSGGRVLPAFGLGAPNAVEHAAFGVERSERSTWFDEALPLMQRLWTEDRVTHRGDRFHIQDVTIRPKPVQRPLEVWGGGTGSRELDRVARLCDGWLPSFCTAAQAAAGRAAIEDLASQHDRGIDPEHFGAVIAYRPDDTSVPGPLAELVSRRSRNADPSMVVPTLSELPDAIGRFVDVGFSKFVVVPIIEPTSWRSELASVADLVTPLEN